MSQSYNENRDGNGIHTRVFVALQHQLRVTSARIPELHTTILRATENPVAVSG